VQRLTASRRAGGERARRETDKNVAN